LLVIPAKEGIHEGIVDPRFRGGDREISQGGDRKISQAGFPACGERRREEKPDNGLSSANPRIR
jgi:hypothetical protein